MKALTIWVNLVIRLELQEAESCVALLLFAKYTLPNEPFQIDEIFRICIFINHFPEFFGVRIYRDFLS